MTSTAKPQLPGLERIRARFVLMLSNRQAQIAEHALSAWDGETLEDINGNLAAAQAILHQIAGSAGSIGLPELGRSARDCELAIARHLEGPDADLAICPGELIHQLDGFVLLCLRITGSETAAQDS
ncbi:Hpt domain-containing protein [Sulfitobacter aestuarii]|uniref:Hpt domain-containing protein n=1 Tax=Sulfitobacter aestuarii TaxID=2161676 RepID=A0ABW5U696_9RHOB